MLQFLSLARFKSNTYPPNFFLTKKFTHVRQIQHSPKNTQILDKTYIIPSTLWYDRCQLPQNQNTKKNEFPANILPHVAATYP